MSWRFCPGRCGRRVAKGIVLADPRAFAEPAPVIAEVGEGGEEVEPQQVAQPGAAGEAVDGEGEGDEKVGLGEDVAAEGVEPRVGEEVGGDMGAGEQGGEPEHVEACAGEGFAPGPVA